MDGKCLMCSCVDTFVPNLMVSLPSISSSLISSASVSNVLWWQTTMTTMKTTTTTTRRHLIFEYVCSVSYRCVRTNDKTISNFNFLSVYFVRLLYLFSFISVFFYFVSFWWHLEMCRYIFWVQPLNNNNDDLGGCVIFIGQSIDIASYWHLSK